MVVQRVHRAGRAGERCAAEQRSRPERIARVGVRHRPLEQHPAIAEEADPEPEPAEPGGQREGGAGVGVVERPAQCSQEVLLLEATTGEPVAQAGVAHVATDRFGEGEERIAVAPPCLLFLTDLT